MSFSVHVMMCQGLGREILERLIKDIADKGIVEFFQATPAGGNTNPT